MMRRAVSVALSALLAALLAGAGVLVWLDKNSMGVMRYLANKNRVWNGAAWSARLPIVAAAASACLLVWAVVGLAGAKGGGAKRPWVLLAVLALLAALFVLAANTALVRAYYFLCAILAAAALLQAAKCMIRQKPKKQG